LMLTSSDRVTSASAVWRLNALPWRRTRAESTPFDCTDPIITATLLTFLFRMLWCSLEMHLYILHRAVQESTMQTCNIFFVHYASATQSSQ
jgi:hypothetical protein